MRTEQESPPDGGTQDQVSTGSQSSDPSSLLGWIGKLRCRWGFHSYSYDRTQYGGVILTEKCCMKCGTRTIENPVPTAK
jgi:hypothetical protein